MEQEGKEEQVQPQETFSEKGKGGLTWRSLSGILYAAVVLQPAFLWLYFMTGGAMSWAAMYTAALLFSELLSGKVSKFLIVVQGENLP